MSAKRRGVRKVRKKDRSVSKSKDAQALLNLAKALKDYQRSQKRLALALTSAHLGIWEATIKTGEIWWSDNVPKILRIPKKQLGNSFECFLKILPQDDQRILSEVIQKCLDSDNKLFVQHRIKHADGSVRWMEVVGKVFRDRKGNANKLSGSIQDITDIKQSNFEGKQWETRYKILASTSGQVIYDYDLISGKIKWSGTVEVLGFSEEELATIDRWEKQIHREDIKLRSEQLQIGKEALSAYDIKYRFKTKSKRYISIQTEEFFFGMMTDRCPGCWVLYRISQAAYN